MKKIILGVLLLTGAYSMTAQVDVSLNPISLLFSNINASIEFGVKDDIGVEFSPSFEFDSYKVDDVKYTNTGLGGRVIGKYYFSPNKGLDKWNIGPYIKYGYGVGKGTNLSTKETVEVTRNRFAVGFYTGYKWVSRKNVVFELGFGLGRAFVNKYESDDQSVDLDDFPILNLDATGKLALGYRFGGVSEGSGRGGKRR